MSLNAKKNINIELQQAVRAAASWHVQLNTENVSPEIKQAWQTWLLENPTNQQAWQQVEKLQGKFSLLPASISGTILDNSELSRRELLQRLAGIAIVAPVSWLAYQKLPWQEWQAQHKTAIGQQKQLNLPDGGLLILNTDTAVNINYSANERIIELVQGEVIVETATEPNDIKRPFYVISPHGKIQALGTRFITHTDNDNTQVIVLEHAVRITPKGVPHKELIIKANQHLSFNQINLSAISPANQFAASWRQGSVVVVDMPLGLLIKDLARYRSGILICDDTVAHLKVSGAFSINDTELALQAITSSFPVRQRRLSRYWVKILPNS